MVITAARTGVTAEVTRAQGPRHPGILVCMRVRTRV